MSPEEGSADKQSRTPAQALLGQMGGISGLIYSALPVAVLVPVNTAFGLLPAISAALGVGMSGGFVIAGLLWGVKAGEKFFPCHGVGSPRILSHCRLAL